jgi:hypothetical protein
VALVNEESGLMGRLRQEFQINSAMWRAAAAELGLPIPEVSEARAKQAMAWDYLTPEEARSVNDSDQDKGWGVEARLPWSDMNVDGKTVRGKTMGWNVVVLKPLELG